MIFGFWSVFTVPAITIAIIGGAATGALLGSIYPPNPLVKGHRVFIAFMTIGFIGLIFFAGQTVEVALGEDPELWPRLAARAVLWMLFAVALAMAGVWAQNRRWTKKP